MRFWISWYQPTEDYRPLKEGISYWKTGQTVSEPVQYTLCAVVDAEDKGAAKKRILEDWPEAHNWRFCDSVPDGWEPSSDRFPAREKGVGVPRKQVDLGYMLAYVEGIEHAVIVLIPENTPDYIKEQTESDSVNYYVVGQSERVSLVANRLAGAGGISQVYHLEGYDVAVVTHA